MSTSSQKVKQVLIARIDLSMRRGKESSQLAHSSVNAVLNVLDVTNTLHKEWLAAWLADGHAKISVGCSSEAELLELHTQALLSGLPCALVRDEGITEFHNVLTYTALAIGPAPSELINVITGNLKLR